MWHLYVNGDTNSPYVFNDRTVLNQYLSTLPIDTIVMIRTFDVILKSETVHGITGANALPPAPNPAITIEVIARNHVQRKQN